MCPTLSDHGFYWIDRTAYKIADPQRGDIVAIKDPSDHGFDVKRIIAMPGESVWLKNGQVYINGKLLHEPYLPPRTPTYVCDENKDQFVCFGKQGFFVMGDNRNNSIDSRYFGSITRREILGRIME